MTTIALQILESFDRLPQDEKRAVATEILRRTVDLDQHSPKPVKVGAFRSGRSDVSTRAEEILREAASRQR